MDYLKAGTIDQPYVKRKGDGVRIDWGYAYLGSNNAPNKDLSIGNYYDMKQAFITNGKLLPNSQNFITRSESDMPAMAYTENLGKVDNQGKSGYVMLGYDDIYSIEYFYERRMAYWKHSVGHRLLSIGNVQDLGSVVTIFTGTVDLKLNAEEAMSSP